MRKYRKMKIICASSNKKFDSDIFAEKEDYEFIMAFPGNGLLEIVKEESPDLILLYWDEQCNGISILKKQYPDIPLLVVSDEKNIDRKIDCFERGADSYIVYPFKLKELLVQMRTLVRSFEWQRMRYMQRAV